MNVFWCIGTNVLKKQVNGRSWVVWRIRSIILVDRVWSAFFSIFDIAIITKCRSNNVGIFVYICLFVCAVSEQLRFIFSIFIWFQTFSKKNHAAMSRKKCAAYSALKCRSAKHSTRKLSRTFAGRALKFSLRRSTVTHSSIFTIDLSRMKHVWQQ